MSDEVDFSTSQSILGSAILGSGRLGRASWVASKIVPADLYLLQDGEFSRVLLHEALECFVNGQFIAAITLGFSFVERSISGRLSFNQEKKAALGRSEELIGFAQARGWLSLDQVQSLNDLRQLRNAIVHFKEPLDEAARPEIVAILKAKTLPQYLEHGAKQVLQAAIGVLDETAL